MKNTNLDRFIRSASYEPERFYIPSSLLSLNLAIDNINGFQSGRILEIVGAYSTGKTTLALDLIKNAQSQNKKVLFADIERTFDRTYAAQCGVDVSLLDTLYADTAENNLTVIEQSAERYDVIVLDSLPALIPAEELDKTYNDPAKMASSAGLLTRFYRRIVPIIDTHNTLLVLLNQMRANISTLSRIERKPYGPYAASHALTWRVELARTANEEQRAPVQAKVTKNKLGKERGLAQFDILYGKGLDIEKDILTKAVQSGIVSVSKNGWYTWHEQKAHGDENALQLFDMTIVRNEVISALE